MDFADSLTMPMASMMRLRVDGVRWAFASTRVERIAFSCTFEAGRPRGRRRPLAHADEQAEPDESYSNKEVGQVLHAVHLVLVPLAVLLLFLPPRGRREAQGAQEQEEEEDGEEQRPRSRRR